MPAPVTSDETRHPALLTALFWAGVALAPVAALILLVADGNGPLRFAAVLAILAVVLIGLSIALRADGGAGQARTAELREEIEQLRRELREEIVAAAQRGNQALDQAHRTQEAVASLRRRIDASSAALAGTDESVGAGRARVAAAEPVDDRMSGPGRFPAQDEASSRWGRSDREQEDDPVRRHQSSPRADRPATGPAGVYGGDRPATGSAGVYGGEASAAGSAGVYGADRPASGSAGVYGGDRPATGVYGARPAEHDSAPRPLGVVRHTETVHVTTRQTIVDGGLGDAGGRYGAGYAGRWSPGPEERPWAGSGDAEDRSRAGHGEAEDRFRRGDDRSWSEPAGARDARYWAGQREEGGWSERDEREWSGQQWDERDQRDGSPRADQRDRGWNGEQYWDPPAEQSGRVGSNPPDDEDAESGEYWSQLRAGNRWAAVREDDGGRELRVGERRAEVHADSTGTEYRVADRWAAVRRDEPRRGHDRDGEEGRRGGWAEPESRPALPAGGVPVPEEWRPPRQRQPETYQPQPERRRQEERYGYPPQDDAPRAGGARSADRWS